MIFLSSVCVTVRKIVSVTTGETEEDSSCGRACASVRRDNSGITRYMLVSRGSGLLIVKLGQLVSGGDGEKK